MKNIQFYGVVPSSQTSYTVINKEIERIEQALSQKYETDYAGLAAPLDPAILMAVKQVAKNIRSLQPTMLFLVGIGGSNMGMLALVQALYGVYYHDNPGHLKFYCADTIDSDLDTALCERMEAELKNGGTVILCIVTKSGTTTETIINGALGIELMQKYRPDTYRSSVVVITDEASPLYVVAQKEKYHILLMPKLVGGRFSVFTAVGLFP